MSTMQAVENVNQAEVRTPSGPPEYLKEIAGLAITYSEGGRWMVKGGSHADLYAAGCPACGGNSLLEFPPAFCPACGEPLDPTKQEAAFCRTGREWYAQRAARHCADELIKRLQDDPGAVFGLNDGREGFICE